MPYFIKGLSEEVWQCTAIDAKVENYQALVNCTQSHHLHILVCIHDMWHCQFKQFSIEQTPASPICANPQTCLTSFH